mmetsp:Transcript_8151/g.14934  ORF Transcript_8151/g.14934 Transcript_8151/m.14934 type:complete len:81 (+) Transcript_8151:1272-1514(+)
MAALMAAPMAALIATSMAALMAKALMAMRTLSALAPTQTTRHLLYFQSSDRRSNSGGEKDDNTGNHKDNGSPHLLLPQTL